MARTAKVKSRGANLPVPQDRDQAAASVAHIGLLARKLGRLEADMNDRISRIKEDYEARAEPLRQQRADAVEGLRIWAEANRAALTQADKTKTVDLGTGLLRWRFRPPSVRIAKLDDVIDRLKALGLQRFVRIKEEVNKDAMRDEPDVARAVPGVSIGSAGEDFVVEPYEAALSEGGKG